MSPVQQGIGLVPRCKHHQWVEQNAVITGFECGRCGAAFDPEAHKPPRAEEIVRADEALYQALGPGARLWDAHSVAARLLDAGFVIRRVR